MSRKPLAVANWKMAMTITESLTFVREFEQKAAAYLDSVEVVLCPPFTALWAVAQARRDWRIQLGGQNIAPSADLARTGEISAALLADAGCQWVLLGHWEVRRHLGDDEQAIRRKVRLALNARLKPILLLGEARDETAPWQEALEKQLTHILAGYQAEEMVSMAFVYEPEAAIGMAAPISAESVAAGCGFIRRWLHGGWGSAVADNVRIIYGGSVDPAHAPELLACPDVDGLGATRRGRDVGSFTEIVHLVAQRGVRYDTH